MNLRLKADIARFLTDMLQVVENQAQVHLQQALKAQIRKLSEMLKDRSVTQTAAPALEYKSQQTPTLKELHFQTTDARLTSMQSLKLREFSWFLFKELQLTGVDVIFFAPATKDTADFSFDRTKFSTFTDEDSIEDLHGFTDGSTVYIKYNLPLIAMMETLAHECHHTQADIYSNGKSKQKKYRQLVEQAADHYAADIVSRYTHYARTMDRIQPGRLSCHF